MLYLALFIALISGLHTGFRFRYFLHIFQLEGYKINEYHQWLRQHHKKMVLTKQHLFGGLLIGVIGFGILFSPRWAIAIGTFFWTIIFISSQRYSSRQQKKPLALTSRLKRLAVIALLITVLPALWGTLTYIQSPLRLTWGIYLFGWLITDLGVPYWISIAALLVKPIENHIQNGFKKQAKKKLAVRPNLRVIGITGSYGKTSVKFIVAEILSQKYSVLATPSSYNTPMGICLVVNNKLLPQHQVLVLEMGARYTGDIKELVELANPDMGIVTSVGMAHLETMGPIENIAQVKGELIRHMKPDGITILNADDPRVMAMAMQAKGKVWRVSVANNPADIHASDITYSPEGTSFMVRDETGDAYRFETKLLGKHNILNILLGVAVGREMGLRLRQMAHAMQRIEPVEHRLQLRKQGNITVIDDAFNANPVGAKNAIEILGQFTSGRRIIVTPGMVELGERQAIENKLLGQEIANHQLDLAILIGQKQTEPIQEGLRETDFPTEKIKIFNSFFDAQNFLKTYLEAGDVVLYENDLPDQYNE